MANKIAITFLLFFSIISFSQKNKNTIGFIENKGQIVDQNQKENKSVLYLLNTNGLNVQLRKNGFSYDVYETKPSPKKQNQNDKFSLNNFENQSEIKQKIKFHRIDIDFLNSNSNVKLISEEKSVDYDNYYNVVHASNGITNVHKYQKVTYQNIYNKIDVVFFIPNDSTKVVEYNFVVKPGGNISDIQLQFKGAKTELNNNRIKMTTRFGDMEETLPMSWIDDNNSKKQVSIHYKKIKNNVYGLESSEDITGKKIIIDPVPFRLWGTYHGGPKTDYLKKMHSDNFDNVFITGNTSSQNNFATTGSFITTSLINQVDGYIAKLDSSSNRLWCTYINSNPTDIKTDSNGNIITTGITFSDLIGTVGTFQPTRIYLDGFILKLNTNGIQVWGTYYPGVITGCAIGTNDNIFITGYTTSPNNIATIGVHQQIKNGQEDVFVTKFNQNGQRIWGTYYGGNFDDEANDISIDEFNNTYITGRTESTGNIAHGTSYQTNNNSNTIDGFIAKFNDQGNIVFGTFYGGNQNEFFTSIDYKNNKILISGHTSTQTGISTNNAPFPNPINLYGNLSNGFFSIFSSNGQLLMGSYFQNRILDNQFDKDGNIFFCGDSADNGIGTLGSYKPILNNHFIDSFLVKISPNYNIEWGTYYGGESLEVETNLHINNDFIYLGGRTDSSNEVSSTNAFQQVINGEWEDAFVVKFKDCLANTIASNTPTCIGSTLNLTASGGTNYTWTGPNGFTSNAQNPSIPNANTTHSGQYTCTITGTGDCDGTQTITVFVGDNTKPIPTTNPLPQINGDCNTTISIPTASDNCSGLINATTTDQLTGLLPGTHTIHWTYNDGNGNTETQNQTVIISAVSLPTLTSPQTFCIQQNATINSISITGQNINWHDALTNGNILPNTTALVNGTTYYASQTINGCESNRVLVLIQIQNTLAPTGNANQSFCTTQNATVSDIITNGTNVNWYNSALSTTPLANTTLLTNNTTYYATQTINGCESVNRLAVTISLINTLNATNYSEIICDNLNDNIENRNLTSYNTNLISSTGNIFSYYNSYNDAFNQNGQITNFASYSLVLGTNAFYVRIDSPNTCFQIVTLTLELVSKPNIPINDTEPLCEGRNITLNGGNNYDSYTWSTGATSQTITITQPGSYSVIVTENHGTTTCTSTKNFVVVNSNIATIQDIISSDWTDNNNTITVVLNSNSQGDYEYSINGIDFQNSPVFTNLEAGEYTVFVRDKNGCGIVSEELYLLMYPNFFTPNGDGYNDYWKIKFSENEPNLTIKIFDRYGKFLKQLGTNSIGWDGKYTGKDMPSSDYWFVVTRENGKEHKGHFSLKR